MTTKIFDFTLHLAGETSLDDALHLERVDPVARLDSLASAMQSAGIADGNVMLLDTHLFRRDGADLVARISEHGYATTVMIDPRDPDALQLLNRAAQAGCRGLKYHPYLLNLEDKDFPDAVTLARHAEELGLWVAVCCSYGTIRVHDISGPRLVASLVRGGLRTRIVALHAGGAAALDVMSIALDAPNVLLETSFSIPYWNGSSAELDLAFAIRKVGAERCLYGSDHPHVPLDQAAAHLRAFMDRHGFRAAELDQVLHRTARLALGL